MKHIYTFLIACIFLTSAMAQTIGSKVSLSDANGKKYTGTVTEIQDGKYKIKYDGFDFEPWLTNNQFTVTPQSAPLVVKNEADHSNKIISDTKTKKRPEMNGAFPKIIGTSWSLLSIYTKGTEPVYMRVFPTYLFCNNGRWELQTSFVQMGTYKVQGNRLIQVHDGADKLTGNYKMTWNAAGNYLELDDGKLIFRLRYQIKAKC